MGFNLGDVFITFKTKGEQFFKGLDGMRGALNKFGSGASRAFKAAEQGSQILLGSIAALTAGIVVFGKKSIDAYFGAVEASTKLRTNLLNVKGATEEHVKALEDQASALQSVGVIEDDVIKAGMSQLATFNLQGSTISSLTPKIADMVAQLKGHNATAEDSVAINNLVGKVMTGNIGALSRYGVTLSETQAAQLKSGTETERAAVLNEVLAQNYGKVNEALRNTPQGKITAFKNMLGDLQEGLGELIVRGLSPVVDWSSKLLDKMEEAGGITEYFKNLIKENKDVIIPLAGAIMGALVPALVVMAGNMIVAFAPLIPFLAAGALAAVLVKKLADRMGGWDVLLGKVKEKITTVKDALIRFKDGVKAFIEAFKKGEDTVGEDSWVGKMASWGATIRDVWNTVSDFMINTLWPILQQVGTFITTTFIGAWNLLKAAFEFLWPSIQSLVQTFVTQLLPAIMQAWDAIMRLWNALNPGLMTALKVIGAIIGIAVVASLWLFINGLKLGWKILSLGISIISNVIKWISNIIGWVGNFAGAVKNGISAAIGWFTRLPGTVSDIATKVVDWFKKLPGNIGKALKGLGDVIGGPFKAAFNAVADLWNSTIGAIGFTVPDWVPGVGGKSFDVPDIPKLAMGTGNWRGGMAMVGEHGREAVMLPGGSKVIPASKTREMGSGFVVNGDLNIGSKQDTDYFFSRYNRDYTLESLGLSPEGA